MTVQAGVARGNIIKTHLILTTTADVLLLSLWNSKLTLMMAHVERHLALWYTRAKEMTHRLFIECVRVYVQESAWAVQYHMLHHYTHQRVLCQRPRESLQAKRNLAYFAWMRARLQSWTFVQRVEHLVT